MKIILLLVALWALASAEWELVFEDEFQGNEIDLDKWDHEITAWGGGNREFQLYTDDPENSFVRGGRLFIVPTLLRDNINPQTGEPFGDDFLENGVLDVAVMYGRCTNDGDNRGCYRTGADGGIPPIMSARLRTFERFAYLHGRAEFIAKMPVGDWLWPAIWMLPEDWEYGRWPLSGEIDIVESIGNRDLKFVNTSEDTGIQKMGSTTHWGIDEDQNRYPLTHTVKFNSSHNYGDYFHNYTFLWDENSMRWYIDDDHILTVPDPPVNEQEDFNFYDFGKPWDEPATNPWEDESPMAPFDKAFHFLVNVAVGGTNDYIPDDVINRGDNEKYGKPWTNGPHYETAMQKFWDARDRWYWTWEEEGSNIALQVDSVRVWQWEDDQ